MNDSDNRKEMFEAEFRADLKALLKKYNGVITVEDGYYHGSNTINIEIHRQVERDAGYPFNEYVNIDIGKYFDANS